MDEVMKIAKDVWNSVSSIDFSGIWKSISSLNTLVAVICSSCRL